MKKPFKDNIWSLFVTVATLDGAIHFFKDDVPINSISNASTGIFHYGITHSFETDVIGTLLSIIVGLILYKSLTSPTIRLVLYFLMLTFTCESIGFIINRYHRPTTILWNLYSFIEISFLSFLFWKIFSKKTMKLSVIFLTIAWTFFSIIEALFINPIWRRYDSIYEQIGSLIIIAWSLFYLIRLFREKRTSFSSVPFFWVSLGLLFNKIPIFLLFLTSLLATDNNFSFDNFNVFFTLFFISSILFCSCITISFFCCLDGSKRISFFKFFKFF